MIRTILQAFYTAWVIITFLISLIAAFPLFLILSVGDYAFGRHLMYAITHYWSRFWLFLIGMPVKKIAGFFPEGKYIVVANHISYLDTIVIFSAIPRYFRPLGKKEMAHIPLFGFVYRRLALLVDRSNAESRAKSMRLMWRVLKKEGCIAIFPEGTFNETDNVLKDFYDGAFRLAINTQTPILPIIFPDTVFRWHYSKWWKLWPGRNRIVYLPVINVNGLIISETPKLKKQTYEVMESALKKYRT
jgi:1-acyl-sn-glycerol-3-phosphate acyltransferase